MSYKAALIAYALVKQGIEDGKPVTQMKLYKLVYFAHGLYLATYNEPLINETFQAWKYGPVVPAIYADYKLYGSAPIVDTDILTLFGDTEKYDEDLKKMDVRAKKIINLTWETLKDFNAIQLSNWTHKVGSPWQKFHIAGVNDIDIPNDEIRQYFKDYITKN